MRQALRLIFRLLLCGRREGRVYVVLREELLDDVELPIRDRVVPPQDGAELWRRVGEGHVRLLVPFLSRELDPRPVFSTWLERTAKRAWTRPSLRGPVKSCNIGTDLGSRTEECQ
jgi:hypothetical protein